MAANNGDVELLGVLLAGDGGDESLSANDVEGGDTEQLLGVEDTGLLEDLGGDGDGRVDGVRDDQDVGLGGVLCDALDEALDDTSVDLEKIITGHAGLAWLLSAAVRTGPNGVLTRNAGGDDYDVSAGEGLLEAIVAG